MQPEHLVAGSRKRNQRDHQQVVECSRSHTLPNELTTRLNSDQKMCIQAQVDSDYGRFENNHLFSKLVLPRSGPEYPRHR